MNPLSRFVSRVRSRHDRVARAVCALAVSCVCADCSLGADSTPGCRTDHPEDCDPGWTCRAGVCFRPTTPLSPATDAAGDVVTADTIEDAPLGDALGQGD